jgi:hypothetical protein
VWVSRIAATCTPSASIASSSRGASSPGSITIASPAPSSRAMWQFSWTGPTVRLRTSIYFLAFLGGSGRPALRMRRSQKMRSTL